jgi:threonyl-tRNA synthetase
MERFIAYLTRTAGNFPSWLMPEQAIILWEKYMKYMREKVLDLLEIIRGLVDNRNETIGKKIRDAEMQKTRLC